MFLNDTSAKYSLSIRRFWGKGERWKRKSERGEGEKPFTSPPPPSPIGRPDTQASQVRCQGHYLDYFMSISQLQFACTCFFPLFKGDVIRDDSQRRIERNTALQCLNNEVNI